jgi:hypothetical protein
LAVVIAQAIAITSLAIWPPPPITAEQHTHADQTAGTKTEQCSPLCRWWNWTTGEPVSFYTSILAIFTGVLAVSTIGLWTSTKDAARGGERAANIAEQALFADKRAFIAANGLAQYWELDPATGLYNWRFRPGLFNSGETPTRNMTMHVECEVRTQSLPPGFDFDTATSPPGRGIITPKAGIQGGLCPLPGQPAITPQDILDSQANQKFIYIWGWIRYNDVFPRTPQHITRYCWLVVVTGNPLTFIPNTPGQPPTPGTLHFSSIHHTEGNCADEECG